MFFVIQTLERSWIRTQNLDISRKTKPSIIFLFLIRFLAVERIANNFDQSEKVGTFGAHNNVATCHLFLEAPDLPAITIPLFFTSQTYHFVAHKGLKHPF